MPGIYQSNSVSCTVHGSYGVICVTDVWHILCFYTNHSKRTSKNADEKSSNEGFYLIEDMTQKYHFLNVYICVNYSMFRYEYNKSFLIRLLLMKLV